MERCMFLLKTPRLAYGYGAGFGGWVAVCPAAHGGKGRVLQSISNVAPCMPKRQAGLVQRRKISAHQIRGGSSCQ